MSDRLDSLAARLQSLDAAVEKLRAGGPASAAIQRWRADAAAAIFHLRDRGNHRPLVAILGGTGTGKSTLVNRLVEAEISATSFRRTFTSGAVAITRDPIEMPPEWLGLDRDWLNPQSPPAQGQLGKLAIVVRQLPLTNAITLIDTPDLDGDQPLHHAEADRVFRWAQAIVFLVTPEKYQMTELLPYYRLARRYALPAVFVMNKCEESAVLDDYRGQLAEREWPDAPVFAIPRDDAAYEPPADANLPSLRTAVANIAEILRVGSTADIRRDALRRRSADLVGRLRDQVISPLREQRREIDRLIASLKAMIAPVPGVDVSPVTQQLQRRLQEQSVLYLMGPQRILDRVRQVPSLVMRLPRTVWDLLAGGRGISLDAPQPQLLAQTVPDFAKLLADQFRIHQSRIDDLLMNSRFASTSHDGQSYRLARFDPSEAARIADEELAELKAWLEKRWNKTPRDTAVLNKLIRVLPGGKHLSRWSEAAPYLLAVVLAVHHALLPMDFLVFGSFSLAVWLGEKLSNEVASQTRAANRRISQRFSQLAAEQVSRICQWLEQQAPTAGDLDRLESLADDLGAMTETPA